MTRQISSEITTHISMWGPTKSGKDWLFKGFIKELEYFNNMYQDFQMVLSEYPRGQEQPKPKIVTTPESDPTIFREDRSWLFERRPLLQDDKHLLSGFKHRIIFHNAPGGELLESVHSKKRFQSTLNVLQKSRYILILLDPIFSINSINEERRPLETERDQNHQDDDEFHLLNDDNMSNAGRDSHEQELNRSKTSGLSQEDYLKFLEGLLDELALPQKDMPKRLLAICMTKMDQFQYADPDPWNLLFEVFGKHIYNLFQARRGQFDMKVFPTSAAGFTHHMGNSEPNITGIKLRDRDEWDPINCSQPFFWFFSNSEKEKIQEMSNFFFNNINKYISYPPSRNI